MADWAQLTTGSARRSDASLADLETRKELTRLVRHLVTAHRRVQDDRAGKAPRCTSA